MEPSSGTTQFTIRARDGVELALTGIGVGRDCLVLSGGPGCINYLASSELVPEGVRYWFPEPRGVGRSGGGPHEMATAVSDLEDIRQSLQLADWPVIGHSWGSDLAVRYALDEPDSVVQVIGLAGHGLHKDRNWSEIYHAGHEPDLQIPWNPEVHAALQSSFLEWIHQPLLFRELADSAVPMAFLAAESDIRPNWPLRQLAELVPQGRFRVIPGVAHNLWATHPEIWCQTLQEELQPFSLR